MGYRQTTKRQIRKDRSGNLESYGEITRVLFFTVVPVIVSSAIYNVNSVIDNGLLAANFASLGREAQFAADWGVYTGKYHLLINVPMAVSNALSSSLIPSVSRAVAEGDKKKIRARISAAIRFSMLIAIPSTVGLTVLAGPVNNLLFSGDNSLAIRMTLYGSIAVVFYSLSTVTNAILQGIDKMHLPIFHALIALVLHIGVLEIMALVMDLGIYSMVYANIAFALIMCVLNHWAIRRTIGYRQEIKKTFLIPTISAAIMGGCTFGVYKLFYMVLKSNALATIVSIFVAIAVYGVLLIKLRCLDEDEMRQMPGGTRLLGIFKKVHLM